MHVAQKYPMSKLVNDMSIVKLSNEIFIASSILEITSFPRAEILDSDSKKAFDMNRKAFQQMIFELHKISDVNSTVAEILFVSEKVKNQTFKSKVRTFIVIRKIGNNIDLLNREINTVQANFISALNQTRFETKVLDLSDNSFISLAKNVDCSSLFAVVKKEKFVGNSASYGSYYTWDILNNDSDDTMSGLISAISQSKNCMVSFQIIPTSLTPVEQTYLNELSAQYRQIAGMGDSSVEVPLKANQYLFDRSQKPLFFYNICTFGNIETCRFITTKLLSVLQSGNEKIADCDLIALDLSREKINFSNQFYVYPWIINEKLVNKYRNVQLQQYPVVKALSRLPYLMTTEELNVFFRLPLYDKSMPALTERKASSEVEQFSKDIIGEDTIKFGHLISDGNSDVAIGCPLKSWTQHALVVGMPGTGKTTFAVNILTQFYRKGIPFLAIEPTKAEYRAMIDIVDDLQIFTPGNNNVSPFIINPFIPPKGITVEQYVPSLLAAFKAAFSMDGPLEMIFLKAVNNCYIEHGWKKYSKYGDEDVTVFGMFEYILCFKKTMTSMNYNRETKSNIETAGLLRLMNLIEQNSNIYDTVNTVPIEDLLSKPTVLELNAIDNDEQKSLIMALILSSACVHIKNNQIGDGQLKNVILIDEAHVLLDSDADSEGKANSKGTTVKTVQKMIAEVRSYGTSIIIADQKPSAVTESVVSNTNVKVTFRLTSSKERNLIAESTDMSNNNAGYISQLGAGQAFVYFDKLRSPQLVQTEDTRAADGVRLSVSNKEIFERSKYWRGKESKLIPFRECACSDCCKTCSFKIRSDAEYFAEKLLSISVPKIKDKKILLSYAVRVPQALKKHTDKYSEREIMQLYNCIVIKFLRKAELSLPYTVTLPEIKKVIEKSQQLLQGE